MRYEAILRREGQDIEVWKFQFRAWSRRQARAKARATVTSLFARPGYTISLYRRWRCWYYLERFPVQG
jgi:hypothetical protein